jgi:hypothetical protein
MKTESAIEIVRRLNTCDAALQETEVAEALVAVSHYWVEAARNISMQGVDGAPDWLGFERRIWDLGESLRQCLVKRKEWRSWNYLFDTIAAIVEDRQYAKGRESFILLLGEFAADAHRVTLLRLLDDPEVVVHAISALRRGRIADGVEKVSALASTTKNSRTRQEAKKYLKLFGG